jgi:hypothetical protein
MKWSMITLYVIFSVVFGTSMASHIDHVVTHSSDANSRYLLDMLLLGLSLAFEICGFWSALKKVEHSQFDEILHRLMIVFTAAAFADLLTDNVLTFGLLAFAGLLAQSLLKKMF